MAIPGSDWLEVPTIYFWPIFQAYVRKYPHKMIKYGLIWYSTSDLGSCNSHWFHGKFNSIEWFRGTPMDGKPSDSSVLSPSTKVSRGECIHSYDRA